MIVGLYVRMLYILVLCPALLASGVLTLTIDSHLGTSVEDCFDRISIGEQLPRDAIYRNVTELTTIECEQICKQDKQCQAYDYGVGAKGNATCDLSNLDEKEIKEKNLFQRNPDYDVYVRRFQCEQTPPSPIEPEYNPENGPPHRPVIRPGEEEAKRPMSDDLNPYETSRPSYVSNRPNRPSYGGLNERPDDYTSGRPENDSPPSYGAHRPQDIPYRPERPDDYNSGRPVNDRPPSYGAHKPQDIPYRPERPDDYTPGRPDNDRPPSYGAHKPQDIPYRPERPDDYTSGRPDNDRPPSYGAHKPQNIPYRPERPDDYTSGRPDNDRPPSYGAHKPQDIPYRPERPYKNTSRPDSYDQLYFQDTGRPRPGLWRPDPYHPPSQGDDIQDIYGPKPVRPLNRPELERPQYQYIIRPNKRPSQAGPDPYGQSSVYQSRPIPPPERPYKPTRPYEKPSYTYTGQYASNYGTSQDNSITVEIYDPPRPYKPSSINRPYYGSSGAGEMYGQGYGYNSYSHQQSYSQSASQYGSNSWSQSNQGYNKPQKPSYATSGYGQAEAEDVGYGSKPKPPQKPLLNSNSYGSQGYGGQSNYDSQSNSINQGYGSQSSSNYEGYGGQSNYGSSNTQGYGQNSYGAQSSTNNEGYGQGSYGSQSSTTNQGYGQNNYESKPSQNSPGYGQNSYGSESSSSSQGYGQSSYESQYTSSSQGYGQNSYGSQSSTSNQGYGQSSYGSQNSNSYGGQSSNEYIAHESQGGQYGSTQGGYGGSPSTNAYGNSPSSNQYGGQQSGNSYSDNDSGYRKQDSNSYVDRQSSKYGSQNSNLYGSSNSEKDYKNQISHYYGSNYGDRFDYKENGYYGSHLGYGTHHLYGIKPGSYGKDPNQQYRPIITNKGPYGESYRSDSNVPYGKQDKQPYNRQFGNEIKPNIKSNIKPDPPIEGHGEINRVDFKPVYEPEAEKSKGDLVTSKPVAVGGNTANPTLVPSYEACFRRVLAGKRALRSHVRKVVNCERLEDCRRECAEERRFHCESFNYRLDPTFRGKGLCELMTKPIEAFDLQEDFVEDKDYDFYELDRNSLEPYCPETLKGPGLLHSGYLSSKPAKVPGQDNHWRDRMDVSVGYKSYNRVFDERRTQSYNKRYEDQLYVPYQIGIIKNNDDRENWGHYGGNYGGIHTYYKDRDDYHKSKNHWGITEPPVNTYHGVKHHSEKDDFNYHSLQKNVEWEDYGYGYGSWKRGQWNNSGSFWKEFGGDGSFSKIPVFKDFEARSDDNSKDCSSRRRPGMSLGSGAIRRSLLAHTVVECEAACFNEREFKCVSYSYRYSSSPGSDNCFLSERPYRGLEMSADSGSDVYAMPLHQDCLTISTKPWVESECFWHVRSGAAVSGKAVRAALTVTGLGACEAECIRAHSFFCRGFSFRFDAPTIGDDLENCILTSSPPTSLELNHGLRPNKHELYARGNYGRGCEPALYDDVQREPQCYLQYESAAKLTPISIRGRAQAKDERACGHACTDAPFRCLSFSFKMNKNGRNDTLVEVRIYVLHVTGNNARPDTENCLLSEIRLFDLQRGVDYEHSSDDLLFAFDLFNGQCWRKVHGKHEHDVPTLEIPHPLSAPTIEETYPGTAPDFIPPPPETYIASSGPSGPGFSRPEPPKPYIPEVVYKPAYDVGPPQKPVYIPASGPDITGPSGPPSYPSSNFRPGYPTAQDFESNPPSYSPPKYRPTYKPDYLPSGPNEPAPRPSYSANGSGYKFSYDTSGLGYKVSYDTSGSGYKPSYPSAADFKPSYGPAYPPYSHDVPGYKPAPGPSGPGYKPQNSVADRPYPSQDAGYGPGRPGRPSDSLDESLSVSWRHYTVSGFPCRKGTACEQNVVAGHWACEPEGGEIGSWDYCCAATHRCGYSEGFKKPWCYVGPSHDQWRPCSEKYYPYHQHKVPHPSQGLRAIQPRPDQNQKPSNKVSYIPADRDRDYPGGYLSEADKKYWDDLYKDGPQAYYDKHGNPLPGYTRVPIEDRPHIKYQHNPPRPGSGYWVPVSSPGDDEPPTAGGLGVPRYWPVAYLHKGPPPNITYFKYNETTTERQNTRPQKEQSNTRRVNLDKPIGNDVESRTIENGPRAEKRINITGDDDDIFELTIDNTSTTTYKPEINETDIGTTTEKEIKINDTETQSKPLIANIEKDDIIRGIDGKLHDFTESLEVYDIEDVKGDKISDYKTLEAEERQIEAIGRLLASRRSGKLVIKKRSQKDLESKNIALDKDFMDFNFGNKFPTSERRGVVQKVSKDDIDKNKFLNDKSLEVSETTFVRPPRVLSTTENIRKAIVNGKVFYDATIRDQRELYSNSSRRAKNLRLEENRAPSVIPSMSTKKKNIRTRTTNPIRRVRRVYKKRYNPEEVRKRLLEREKNKNASETIKS